MYVREASDVGLPVNNKHDKYEIKEASTSDEIK
jgi:hypothetical protein